VSVCEDCPLRGLWHKNAMDQWIVCLHVLVVHHIVHVAAQIIITEVSSGDLGGQCGPL
jgi:hypothetical protein